MCWYDTLKTFILNNSIFQYVWRVVLHNWEGFLQHVSDIVIGTHKRMAYTAFWTKAPPGRKKNIPKGIASNG